MTTPPRTPADTADDPAQGDQMASFETSLNELEQLVTRMEGGDLSLDESIASFERGCTFSHLPEHAGKSRAQGA
jgi:exonuclease VII small subunit